MIGAALLGTYIITNFLHEDNFLKYAQVDFPITFKHLIICTCWSILRICIALLISYVISVKVGIKMANSPEFAGIMLPCIDVMQSMPVSGFLTLSLAYLPIQAMLCC